MVELYAAWASKAYEVFYFDKVYPFLNTQRRNRIDSFLHVEDALRSLAGDWLTRLVLSEKLHVNISEILIEHDKNGKPFNNPPSGFHFNISHSGDWTVCSISALPVGIDIEKVQPIDLGIAKDCFTENEFETMTSYTDRTLQLNYFYDIWTIKESYLKAIGSGLTKNANSFGAKINRNQILLTGDVEKGYCFRQYDFDISYKLCACSLETQFSNNINIRIPE
ncbi:MAG: 4'-phosphopantetheinyl transferase superfamily protein [Bacteroidia bacterium]|nr:4'-phosphopantetheinyl transferase superfamily protein [Bacteroidia bacterium]